MGTAVTFLYTGAKQTYPISIPGKYKIECYGAEGGSANGNAGTGLAGSGGKGAYVAATFNLPICNLIYAVGQMEPQQPAHGGDQTCAGGGGMSAVAIKGATPSDDVPLVIAGGGGGGTEIIRGGAVGGVGQGFGGTALVSAYAGGGWNTTATTCMGKSWVEGLAIVAGSAYGGMQSYGGWGGGGGGQDDAGGGGGGGYYGGASGIPSQGGYSYASPLYNVSNAAATPGANFGNGYIVITLMEVKKYLVLDSADGNYKFYSTGAWSSVGPSISEAIFKASGMDVLPVAALTLLTSPRVFVWTDNSSVTTQLNYNLSIIPLSQKVVQNYDYINLTGKELNKVTIVGEETDTKVAISTDGGVTWKANNSGNWVIVDINNKLDFSTNGMNISRVSALTKNQLRQIKTSTIRFAYLVSSVDQVKTKKVTSVTLTTIQPS